MPLNLLRLDPGHVGVERALSEIARLRSLIWYDGQGFTLDMTECIPLSQTTIA
ncbi:hypothetical protein KSF_023970 [Reticulibacter mediterranei]|uniref:Uncharacterized protein n=1 Tax=Reticulibacter mediterranei TaxID=2778369 RepID=A0A8J3MYR4_9CHLR|nr:hypothetical protein KSF_023970 [Reticulibacter mediterranei]